MEGGGAPGGTPLSGPATRARERAGGDTAVVDITSIAAGGDGVGRVEGLAVFVPRTAPGDRAVVRLAPRPPGARFARGELVSLERAAPERVEPPCPHYTRDRCGGCQLQHIAYDAQRAAKGGIIRDALVRIGRREVAPPPVEPSPLEWRYRRKLTLAMRHRGGRWIAGLHPYDDPAAVFPLDDCPITDERVVAVWREIMAAAADLPHAGALRGAVRLLGSGDDGASLTLEGGRAWPTLQRFADRVPSLRAIWWLREGARGRPRPVLDRRQAAAPGASFIQVNPGVAERLHDYVVERARAYAPRHVVDAYAGVGDTAAALAASGAHVDAIELDPEAARHCAERLPAGSRAHVGRVEALLPRMLPADVVLLNPPRGGVDSQVTAALRQAAPRPRAVIYVSCNPATLARDLAQLPAYAIASLVAFDMFPQTAHVETVCELVPEAA